MLRAMREGVYQGCGGLVFVTLMLTIIHLFFTPIAGCGVKMVVTIVFLLPFAVTFVYLAGAIALNYIREQREVAIEDEDEIESDYWGGY